MSTSLSDSANVITNITKNFAFAVNGRFWSRWAGKKKDGTQKNMQMSWVAGNKMPKTMRYTHTQGVTLQHLNNIIKDTKVCLWESAKAITYGTHTGLLSL